jgi:putative ABC transport system substrate-binding protein
VKTRREFLVAGGAGLCVLAAPLSSRAQQANKVWRVGFFYLGSREMALDRLHIFLEGMRKLGYVEGKNFVVELRFADGQYDRLPGISAELVGLKVDVIVANGTAVYGSLQRATSTIPVVITTSPDPVGDGIAASLARPGGNFTGLATSNAEVAPKYIELLRIAVPKVSRVAALMNTTNAAHSGQLKIVRATAQKVGITVVAVDAHTPDEIERGFKKLAHDRAEGVIVLADTFFAQQARQIAELALKNRLPAVVSTREQAAAGAFMSYGGNTLDFFRQAATYVDKILKGAKPGELPIELPTKFALVINRKTAKAIGLSIPRELLLRADEIIE